MIKFIIKNFGVIIESLIVVALIVAFSFWDPFGWFRGETKIKNTPVSLRSVKEIGQLVTAEYYGEVVASLKESMIEDYVDTTLQREVNTLFLNILAAIDLLKQDDKENKSNWFNWKGTIKQGNIARKFGDRFQIYTENYLYFPLINYLAETLSKSNKIKTAGEREEQILWYLFTADKNAEIDFARISDTNPGFLKNFIQHYNTYRTDSVRQEKIKKEIIYIGRGWVKAGIDFQDFNQAKFWYDQKTRTIYFRKFEPKILDCDINPWYIPERQIKGFELVVATGKIKNPFEDSRKVKLLCKEKLRKQALQSGILEQARSNARLSIVRLFSLLMEEPVEDVVFSSGKYQLLMQEIMADSVINETESQFLKTILQKDSRVTDTAWNTSLKIQVNDLKDFCSDLRKFKFGLNGQHFGYFSPALADFYKDGILKDDDIKNLSGINKLFAVNISRFGMKIKLFNLYCELSPEFKTVFDLLENDLEARNYLQLDPELFSAKNKTQYRLSNQHKKEFLQIVDDQIKATFAKDPDFEALFWFDSVEKYKTAISDFNLQVFNFATISQVTTNAPRFEYPFRDASFVAQLDSLLDRRKITLNR